MGLLSGDEALSLLLPGAARKVTSTARGCPLRCGHRAFKVRPVPHCCRLTKWREYRHPIRCSRWLRKPADLLPGSTCAQQCAERPSCTTASMARVNSASPCPSSPRSRDAAVGLGDGAVASRRRCHADRHTEQQHAGDQRRHDRRRGAGRRAGLKLQLKTGRPVIRGPESPSRS